MTSRHSSSMLVLAGLCLVAASCVAGPALAQVGLSPADTAACDAAGTLAEQQHDVPSGLLRAIGRVESGRRDPATGRVAAWPWAINAEGRGQLLGSRTEALATVRALQQSGVASIDVGCFQVNLVHHPLAFPAIEDGFDPLRNADYAARFLVSLRYRTGSWDSAVAAYHSATPERGLPYRDRVLAGWSRDGMPAGGLAAGGSPMADPLPTAPKPLVIVRMVTWSPPVKALAGAMRIWTPSAAGQGASIIRITRG